MKTLFNPYPMFKNSHVCCANNLKVLQKTLHLVVIFTKNIKEYFEHNHRSIFDASSKTVFATASSSSSLYCYL